MSSRKKGQGQMSQDNKCAYCKRPLDTKGRRFCGESCRSRHSEMRRAAKAAKEGRICKHCKIPLANGNQSYCSRVCQVAHTTKLSMCPVCMKRYRGRTQCCSQKCAKALWNKRQDAVKMRQWLETRRDQAPLETIPTITHLFRLSLTTASGLPIVIKCWTNRVADYPADPSVRGVLWRDENSVYCLGTKIKQVIGTLESLSKFEIDILTDTKVIRK